MAISMTRTANPAPESVTEVALYVECRIALHMETYDADTPQRDKGRIQAEAKVRELTDLLAYMAPTVEAETAA